MTAAKKSLVHVASLIAVLVVLYFAGGPLDHLKAYSHELLLDVGIAITLAVSLNLILGMTGQFSIGHAGFLAAGAYTCVILAGNFFAPQVRFWCLTPFHFSATTGFTLVMVTGTLAGALVAAVLGLIVGLPTLRLRGDYLAIATLGFGEILAVVVQNTNYLGGATGLSLNSMRSEWLANQPDPDAPLAKLVSDYSDQVTYYVGFFGVYAVALLAVVIVRNIKYSTEGRALLAIREDPIASEAVGIPTTRYKVAAFVIGAALAGAAGGMLAHHKSLLNPDSFRFMRSIEIVAMVILGGQGSVTGSILAAALLTILPEGLRSATNTLAHVGIHLSFDIEKWRMVIYSLMIILAMLFRPQGLFGRYEITDVVALALGKGVARSKKQESRSKKADEPVAGETVPSDITIHDARSPIHDPIHDPTHGPILSAEALTIRFGGLTAVDSFCLSIRPRELVGLIGPNGAGKTTVFNVLTGVYQPTSGGITLHRVKLGRMKPHRIAARGVARTFQNIRLFGNLSVIENVQIAQHTHNRHGLPTAILRPPAFYRQEFNSRHMARELLALMSLDDLENERANSLSYGDQRRLEIARALATRPQLLLLDEPAAGMNPSEKKRLMDLIRSIRDRFGVAILIIEHDMQLIMGISERIIVLDYGKTIATGTPKEVRTNPAVIEAYLGAS